MVLLRKIVEMFVLSEFSCHEQFSLALEFLDYGGISGMFIDIDYTRVPCQRAKRGTLLGCTDKSPLPYSPT